MLLPRARLYRLELLSVTAISSACSCCLLSSNYKRLSSGVFAANRQIDEDSMGRGAAKLFNRNLVATVCGHVQLQNVIYKAVYKTSCDQTSFHKTSILQNVHFIALTFQTTKYIYVMYVPSSELGLSYPLSRQRVRPPPRTKGGGGHSPAGEGLGESQLRRLNESLAHPAYTLCFKPPRLKKARSQNDVLLLRCKL
jgi:hypothetical protein